MKYVQLAFAVKISLKSSASWQDFDTFVVY